MVDLNNFRAVSATQSSGRVGDKYAFIPTLQVVEVLGRAGWEPVKVSEARTIKSSQRAGFQKHLLRFRQPVNGVLPTDALKPEIVLVNSHDGCSAFQLMAGIFRVACSNGLIVADSMFATHRVKHVGYTDSKVESAIVDVTESTPRILSRVEEFKALPLTKAEQGAFAEAALLAHADGDETAMPEGVFKDRTINLLLAPRRAADTELNLWNTFNIVQEKFINGARYMANDNRSFYRPAKARAIKSVDRGVTINKALWALTERMAELKGAGNG